MLHAIGNSCHERQMRVLFVSSEAFTNDLVGAIKSHRTPEFREKYRNVDLLLVDDIDFLAGKESSQEEFYHTFNTLYDSGAQVVVASSQPPGNIKKLDQPAPPNGLLAIRRCSLRRRSGRRATAA